MNRANALSAVKYQKASTIIILHCDFVNNIWTQMQPILSSLHRLSITDEEKALGIVTIKSTTGIVLRNWLTYKLREQVMLFERKAYHSPKAASIDLFKAKFNQSMALEIKHLLFLNLNFINCKQLVAGKKSSTFFPGFPL